MPEERGIQLEVTNAPATAFVDGKMIKGINEHLFAVLRDIVYVSDEIMRQPGHSIWTASDGITNAVFHILRNADILRPLTDPNLVVCWGGHSISREEYDYTKQVGLPAGPARPGHLHRLRSGRDERPDEGRHHRPRQAAHQRRPLPRHLRARHHRRRIAQSRSSTNWSSCRTSKNAWRPSCAPAMRIVVFPGGVGTAEEILYLLGILLHPDNAGIPFPLIFTGPASGRRLLRRDRPVHRRHPRAGAQQALPDHRRRSGGGGARRCWPASQRVAEFRKDAQ